MPFTPWHRRTMLVVGAAIVVIAVVAVTALVIWWPGTGGPETRTAQISFETTRAGDTASTPQPDIPPLNFVLLDTASLRDVGPIAERLAQTHGGAAADYASKVTLDVNDEAGSVVVTVRDDDAGSAVDLANAAADAWVENYVGTPVDPPGSLKFSAAVTRYAS